MVVSSCWPRSSWLGRCSRCGSYPMNKPSRSATGGGRVVFIQPLPKSNGSSSARERRFRRRNGGLDGSRRAGRNLRTKGDPAARLIHDKGAEATQCGRRENTGAHHQPGTPMPPASTIVWNTIRPARSSDTSARRSPATSLDRRKLDSAAAMEQGEVKTAAPYFDFNSGMFGLLIAGFPLEQGYSARFPVFRSFEPAAEPAWIDFQVTRPGDRPRRSRQDGGSLARGRAFAGDGRDDDLRSHERSALHHPAAASPGWTGTGPLK